MSIDRLRMIVGFSIITSHLLTFFIILFFTNLFSPEKQEISLLVSPVFAVYLAAIVRRFTREENSWDSTLVHPSLMILALGAGILFSISLPTLVLMFGTQKVALFADLKLYMGLIESVLGLYTGAIVDRLFGAAHQAD
jgi:hypothetical protein